MKTKLFMKASTIVVVFALLLFGSQIREKQLAMAAEEANTGLISNSRSEAPIEILTVAASKTIAQNEKAPMLTEDFIKGTWVNKEGFVCSYNKGVFVDSDTTIYTNCIIKKGCIVGGKIEDEVSIPISIIDKNTIKLGRFTAVRADSKEGKEYLKQLGKLLLGSWIYTIDSLYTNFEFENKKATISNSEDDEKEVFSYQLSEGKLKLTYDGESESLYIRISDDTMSLFYDEEEVNLYRQGSQRAKDALSGKLLVAGEWVYVSEDEKTINKWSFDAKNTLKIYDYSKKKDKKHSYSAYRDKNKQYIKIDGDVYRTNYDNYENILYLYKKDNENDLRILYAADSKEGSKYLKKAKTIYQEGKIITRTFTQKVNNERYPEMRDISLTLDCMSNLWLEDYVSLEECDVHIDISSAVIGTPYELYYKGKLKNATLTFKYNKDELQYSCEKDLVIVRFDEDTGSSEVLATTRKSGDSTVSAKINKDGIYFLADSYILNGGIRSITEANPRNTEWARNCDTGDILPLLDLNYVNESGNSFSVSTVAQLASVVYYVNTTPNSLVTISLENDIDLNGYDWASMGWNSTNGAEYPFSGIFYGNGHSIKNLTIKTKDDDVGLFGWETFSSVYELTITDASVSGGSDVGIMAGQSICSNYTDCHVDGSVNGGTAGSLIGYEANTEFDSCTADVVVNGEKFNFLSWNQKEKSEIVIENYVTITIDEKHTVTRPKVEGYSNLGWTVIYNGEVVLDRNAENEYSYQYFGDMPGNYEIYLTAYVNGQYVPISNTVSYKIES